MAEEIRHIVTIAADISKIRGDLNVLEGDFRRSFSKIEQIATSALSAFGVGLGVAGLVAFGKTVVEQVGHLQDLADQTGLSAQTLSGLKSELEGAGVSLDTFAKGILIAQKTLGGTDDEAKGAGAAVKALGLDLRDLQNSSPDVFLQKVSDALATVGNEFERKAISAKIFGRAGAEASNAIANLSGRLNELRSGGLDAATIKSIDELGDSINKLKNSLVNFAAAPIANFFNFIRFVTGSLSEREQAVNQLDALADKGLAIAARIRAANELRSQGSRAGIASDAVYNALLKERDALLAQMTSTTAKLGTESKKAQPFKNLLAGSEDLKKVKNEVDNFLDVLQKQLATLENKQIELKFGAGAGLTASLDAQFERFKDNLRDKQLPIPKGLDEFFGVLKDKIVAADDATRKLQESLKQLEGFDLLDASTGSKALEEMEKKAAAVAKDLGAQLKEIEAATSLETLPESERRIEIIRREFEERKNIAMDYLAALKESGATETQIVAETARVNEAIAKSSQAAIEKINEDIKKDAEEVTEFQRRQWERMADAISDLLTDLLDGQIKSWDDLAKRISRTLTSITAEAGSAELKKILLGENYGKKGGELGGLAKGAMDLFQSIFGGAPQKSQPVPAFEPSAKHGGVTPVDALDAEMGQQLAALSQSGTVAIEAASGVAQTAIQTLSSTASAAMTANQATAQTAITTAGTTAQAGIEAVKVAALAAIEAAAAASSGGGGMPGGGGLPFMDMFGGGGGGGGFDILGGGGASAAGQGAGEIGSIMMMHEGGAIHESPLRPDERMIIAQDGEFMMRKEAVRAIGLKNLEQWNRVGAIHESPLQLPRFHDGGALGSVADMPVIGGPDSANPRMERARGGREISMTVNINSPDHDSFRRGQSQLEADFARMMRRVQKDN